MFKNEFLISVLAIFFCLGLVGTALAEPEEASYVSHSFYDQATSPTDTAVEQGKTHAAESKTAPADKTLLQKDNKRPVLCADFGSVEKFDAAGDCKTMFGV